MNSIFGLANLFLCLRVFAYIRDQADFYCFYRQFKADFARPNYVAMGVGVPGLDELGLAAVPLGASLRLGGSNGWNANFVLNGVGNQGK